MCCMRTDCICGLISIPECSVLKVLKLADGYFTKKGR